MKIGIIGTRGIPNRYGGFEQFTEYIAPALVARGHHVVVYNSSLHPFQDAYWHGVRLIKKNDPEQVLGSVGQMIYDFNCIVDSRERDFDCILQLGYTSSSIWSFLFPKRTVVVTNMDGLEWKRSKYSRAARNYLKHAERWAATYSNKLIADSKGIQQHLLDTYQKPSTFIPYGASVFSDIDERQLSRFGLEKYQYNVLIARMEPENNLETILQGHYMSQSDRKLVLVGNNNNRYGAYLRETYESAHTIFAGAIYEMPALNNLRYFSHLYFHGHSVGGTNPSLLEAMGASALIVAHDNIFNRHVLGPDAFYFHSAGDIATAVRPITEKKSFEHFIENNRQKIATCYSWEHITNDLEKFLLEAVNDYKG